MKVTDFKIYRVQDPKSDSTIDFYKEFTGK